MVCPNLIEIIEIIEYISNIKEEDIGENVI